MKSHDSRLGRVLLVGLASFLSPAMVLHKQDYLFDQSATYANGLPPDTNQAEYAMTKPEPKATLVHFDPYFMGGFRNQHMRFVAFLAFALDHNITQILLPSLRWLDPYNKPHSIHHELLFDVHYWNANAEKYGMPTLVDYDARVLEGSASNVSIEDVPCFNVSSSLYSGMDEGVLRNPGTNLRRTATWGMIGQGELHSHCRRTMGANGENNPEKIMEAARLDSNSTGKVYRYTHLVPHGGLIGSGRLWWEYAGLQHKRHATSDMLVVNGTAVQIHPEHIPVEKAVYELLRPSQRLRSATEDAIDAAMRNTTAHGEANGPPRLLALHPRVEQEMLTHRCAKYMEPRLANVLEHIRTFPSFREGANSTEKYRFDLVFVAVSKAEIDKAARGGKGELGSIMNENRETLNHARDHGLFGRANRPPIPIFESGRESAAKVRFPRQRPSDTDNDFQEEDLDTAESLGVIELVASIINFFTVVDADIFIGVKGSTYSTDAFSQRYYQHKEEGGAENYIIGREGIRRLYGPAAPHACD